MIDVRVATCDALSARELHAILRLRAEVFVVEQDCVYLDPDDVDVDPATSHLWVPGPGGTRVLACARVHGPSIGRVVTATDHRRQGLASAVMARAIELATPPATLNAQSRLVGWYEGFGFVPSGDEFVEDGIPHVPMVRTGTGR